MVGETIFSTDMYYFSSLKALPVSLKIRYILSCSVKVRQSRPIFFSSIKLLWRVLGTASERNKHARGAFACIMEQPISARFDSYFARSRFLLSLPLPPPPFFCPRTAKTRSGDEISLETDGKEHEYSKKIMCHGIIYM